MKRIVRNILAIIIGWITGSIVNLGLIKAGHKIFPIKDIDVNNMEALASVMLTLEFKYFIFPFLAHALGTLFGAIVASLIAASHKMKFSLSVGILFLIGGIMVNYMLPGPTWFAVSDIILAYIPMAWLGGKIAFKLSKSK